MEWNDTKRDYPRDKCIHELFEAQVERSPDAVAVVFEDQQLTYRELNRRANQLAHHLQKLGVGPEVMVGICTKRSLEMVVGLLGILKAGGAYVPLDPVYPKERLAFMLEDTKAPVLLTQSRLLSQLPEMTADGRPLTEDDARSSIPQRSTVIGPPSSVARSAIRHPTVVSLDTDWEVIAQESEENPVSGATADNLAYIMYTSGSTGNPKGVCVPHRGVVRLVNGTNYASLTSQEVFLQFAPVSFDASTFEIWGCLLNGARLVVFPARTPSLEELGQVLQRYQVTTLWLTAGLFHEMVEGNLDGLRHVRQLLTGGDVLSFSHVRKALQELPGCRLINGYGPTEGTTFTCCYPMAAPSQVAAPVPIGRPIANTQVYILDHRLNAVPIGVCGELYIGGDGLARDYLNHPKLTAETFIPHPFSDKAGARLYKTGDLARYLPDGNIEFIGRLDHQVKIRGFRIEPGEIEAVLSQHPLVWQAVVVAREDRPGEKRLVAYVVLTQKALSPTNTMRSFLRERLPDYMVPSAFVTLDELPLTPNGKLDRSALPAPEEKPPELEENYVPPRSPLEEALAKIWSNVLAIQRVGIHDNFLELGGHSLLATQVVCRIRDTFGVELPLCCLFETPTVANLAKMIEMERIGVEGLRYTPIQPVSRNGDLPLSSSQSRIWFIQQLNPQNISYNFQAHLQFTGRLDVSALERSLSEIVRRHEIYRTTFPPINERPVQVVHDAKPFKLPVVNLQPLPEAERAAEAQRLINKELQKPFDLTRLPLIRWMLLRLTEEEHLLVHVEPHLLHDGWSFNVFVRELLELYKAFSVGSPSPLPELPIQFADFARWQQEWLQSEAAETQVAYWKKKLTGGSFLLELPSDQPRPPVQSFRGAAPRAELPFNLCASLRDLSRQEGVTLFMTMLTAFVTLLYRYSGQNDICVGSGIANRRCRETEGLIGMIINNIVLRLDLSGNPTSRGLLARVRETTLEAYAHQDIPFDKVVKALQPKRELSHNPLFQVMFGFHDAPMPDVEVPSLNVNLVVGLSNGSSKFDLNVIVIPHSEQHVGQRYGRETDGLTLLWEYNTDLFDETTMTRMIGHYQTLLESMVADPERHISELTLLTSAEQRQLLVEWNDTGSDYPRDKCIQELFEAQVKQTPGAVAVVCEDQQLTYQELNCRANQLAHYLRKLRVKPEVPVGICMERSAEMIVGLLGILKTGGAYVPLDPTYPKERLAFMLRETQAPVLLTQKRLVRELPEQGGRVVCLDEDWEVIAQESVANLDSGSTSDDLAYVIYTSGSTGKPKGVSVIHRGVVRLVKNQTYVTLNSEDVFLQFAPLSFDASTFEIWACLLNGAKLVVFPPHTPSLGELGEVVKRSQVTTLWLTSALFQLMVEDHIETFRGVKQLLAGGDVLSVPHVKKVLQEIPGCRLVNGYGPTENTTFTCCYRMTTPEQVGNSVSIGGPISNTRVYILDSRLAPVPIGVPGELHVGGDGLARSYFDNPELTAETFIPNPFGNDPGARLYKTGDLARWLPNGNIEFLGRLDYQVKIRGFRIEPGEVEAVLSQHPAIRQTVVMAREEAPGDPSAPLRAGKHLVAYVVPNQEQAFTVSELRRFLKEKLPDYMVPSVFVTLEAFPLTLNGKVDRRALPAPDPTRPELDEAFVAPRTPVEEALARIWAGVLKLGRIGIHDDFFDLGGHSLLATQIISRVRDNFHVELPLRALFEKPTVASLAAQIANAQAEETVSEGMAKVSVDVQSVSDEQARLPLAQENSKSI